MEKENTLKDLKQFTGTEHYYEHFSGIKYTDGIKYLANTFFCFWLIDIVGSYQFQLCKKGQQFQLWILSVNKNNTAVITCQENTNKPFLIRQNISYTDFPKEGIEFYCINGIILLKSEY